MASRPLDISVREALRIAEDEGDGFACVYGDDGKPAAIILNMVRAENEMPNGPEWSAQARIDQETDHPDVTGDHVLEVRADGWSIEHPRRCREGGKSLLDCPVFYAANHSMIQGGVTGRFRVRVADDHATRLAFLGDADA